VHFRSDASFVAPGKLQNEIPFYQMKNVLWIIALFLSVSAAWAQEKPVKIVFDISNRDTLAHQTVLRHVTLMASSYPESQFEVVVYGAALPMVISGESSVEQGVRAMATNKNVTFKACEITMKRHHIEPGQLLPGVGIVPDALIEIVTKQGEGWGYIKE
jgi:hypothetical protein